MMDGRRSPGTVVARRSEPTVAGATRDMSAPGAGAVTTQQPTRHARSRSATGESDGSRLESARRSSMVFAAPIIQVQHTWLERLSQLCFPNIPSQMPLRRKVRVKMQQSFAGQMWDVMQTVLSLVACGLYVATTYQEHKEDTYDPYEIALTVIFSVDFLLQFYCCDDRVRYWFFFNTWIDLATIVPVYVELALEADNGNTTGSDNEEEQRFQSGFTFLRFVRVLRVMRILRAFKILNHRVSAVVRQILMLVLTVASIIFLSAGLVQVVESRTDVGDSGGQDLSFAESLYFVIVTIATVGYGDIAPVTGIGKLVVSAMIIVSLILVPIHVNRLNELLNMGSKFRKSYQPPDTETHVLLGGHVDNVFHVKSFLHEFFHPDRIAGVGDLTRRETRVIIMAPQEPSEELRSLVVDPMFEGKVLFIKGSLTVEDDLRRVSAQKADACFILCNKVSTDPEREDAETVLRALMLENFEPNIRSLVQVNLPKNRMTLEMADADQILCVEQLKLSILGLSAVFPGFSTLLSNLVKSFEVASEPQIPWLQEYVEGCDYEIYCVQLSTRFHGCTFTDAAMDMYYQSRGEVFLLAVETRMQTNALTSDSEEGDEDDLFDDDLYEQDDDAEDEFASDELFVDEEYGTVTQAEGGQSAVRKRGSTYSSQAQSDSDEEGGSAAEVATPREGSAAVHTAAQPPPVPTVENPSAEYEVMSVVINPGRAYTLQWEDSDIRLFGYVLAKNRETAEHVASSDAGESNSIVDHFNKVADRMRGFSAEAMRTVGGYVDSARSSMTGDLSEAGAFSPPREGTDAGEWQSQHMHESGEHGVDSERESEQRNRHHGHHGHHGHHHGHGHHHHHQHHSEAHIPLAKSPTHSEGESDGSGPTRVGGASAAATRQAGQPGHSMYGDTRGGWMDRINTKLSLAVVDDVRVSGITGHILLCANTEDLPTVAYFVRPLRVRYMRGTQYHRTVVIMVPDDPRDLPQPKKHQLSNLLRYDDVFLVVGNPEDQYSLEHAGIQLAYTCVILTDRQAAGAVGGDAGSGGDLLDSTMIYRFLSIEHYLGSRLMRRLDEAERGVSRVEGEQAQARRNGSTGFGAGRGSDAEQPQQQLQAQSSTIQSQAVTEALSQRLESSGSFDGAASFSEKALLASPSGRRSSELLSTLYDSASLAATAEEDENGDVAFLVELTSTATMNVVNRTLEKKLAEYQHMARLRRKLEEQERAEALAVAEARMANEIATGSQHNLSSVEDSMPPEAPSLIADVSLSQPPPVSPPGGRAGGPTAPNLLSRLEIIRRFKASRKKERQQLSEMRHLRASMTPDALRSMSARMPAGSAQRTGSRRRSNRRTESRRTTGTLAGDGKTDVAAPQERSSSSRFGPRQRVYDGRSLGGREKSEHGTQFALSEQEPDHPANHGASHSMRSRSSMSSFADHIRDDEAEESVFSKARNYCMSLWREVFEDEEDALVLSGKEIGFFEEDKYRFLQVYAAGYAFSSDMFDFILCQSYFTPELVRFLELLICSTQSTLEDGTPGSADTGHHGAATQQQAHAQRRERLRRQHSNNSRNGTGGASALPMHTTRGGVAWMPGHIVSVPVPSKYVGQPFYRLFIGLLQEFEFVAIGLYRQPSASQLPYVVTGPHPRSTILHAADDVYLLCPHNANMAGLLRRARRGRRAFRMEKQSSRRSTFAGAAAAGGGGGSASARGQAQHSSSRSLRSNDSDSTDMAKAVQEGRRLSKATSAAQNLGSVRYGDIELTHNDSSVDDFDAIDVVEEGESDDETASEDDGSATSMSEAERAMNGDGSAAVRRKRLPHAAKSGTVERGKAGSEAPAEGGDDHGDGDDHGGGMEKHPTSESPVPPDHAAPDAPGNESPPTLPIDNT